ncbi:MAG: hypothetical protein WBD78_04075 [Methylocella sp.]
MNGKSLAGAVGLTRLNQPRIVSAGNEKDDCGGQPNARPLGSYRHAFAIAIGLALPGLGQIARAADALPLPQAAQSGDAAQDVTDYFAEWSDRVKATQADQPSWAAPLNTVTPLLKEFVQYSQAFQSLPNGANLDIYNGGSPGAGIHLIPDYYNEVFIGTPTEQVRTNKQPATGLVDMPFLLIKTRLASANEENGDYVVTAYLAGQAPIGIKPFTNSAYYITPTIAAGKGWGDFDIQATVGTPWPTSNYNTLGTQLATNAAFQYHLFEYLWPEIELNDTYWFNGPRGGMNQLFLSPNVIIGPYPIPGTSVTASLLVGYQTALTPHPEILNPITPMYNHSWQIAARLFF